MVEKLEPYFEDDFRHHSSELNRLQWRVVDQHIYIAQLNRRQNFSSPERKAFVLESANDMLKIIQQDLINFCDKYRFYFEQFGIQL
jgi:hypothetical protein